MSTPPSSHRQRAGSGRPPPQRVGSGRPPPGRDSQGKQKVSSKPPRSLEARLDDALADAERMARRVEQLEQDDPFAASLLALEYLARSSENDVNPLEQHGRTDAWTSAFVRLRVLAERGKKLEGFAADAPLYVKARAEERRLNALLGRDAHATLATARLAYRRARRNRLIPPVVVTLLGAAATIAAALLMPAPYTRAVAAGLGLVSLLAVALLLRAAARPAGSEKDRELIASIERAMQERSAFDASLTGRLIVQRMQSEHPLLTRHATAPSVRDPRAAS